MRGRNRPAAERANAAALALVTSGAEASRQTGIPEQTISQWLKSEEFGALRERKKEEVAAEWWAGIQAYQRSIMRDVDSASLRDKVGAFSIMAEKYALLRGEATTRSEVTHFRDYDDHERQALTELADRILEDGPETVAGGVAAEPGTEVR